MSAQLSDLAASLSDASPLTNTHRIVEPMLGTYSFDGIAWDCYGIRHPEGPELIQIALHGSTIDLGSLLTESHLKTMSGVIEREWLDGRTQEIADRFPLVFGRQA